MHQRKLGFSECLETDLSNGTIKVHIYLKDNIICQFSPHGPRSKNNKLRARMKYWIETRHLKGIYLSFRNIIKFLTLDQLLWLLKDPHPFRLIRESFSCHNLNSVDRKSNIF